LIDRI